MRALLRLLAPLFFRIAYTLFRSDWLNTRGGQHPWVMRLFRLAADLDHRQALSVYGHLLLLHGDSEASRIQGGIYLQRAAEQGDVKAQYQTARLYEQGFGHYFQPSPSRALSFYQQAAEQGHVIAIKRLSEAYENGELGLPVDADLARSWQAKLPG